MKYLSIKSINLALKRIHEGNNTMEHRTGSATSTMLSHYFPPSGGFSSTPEQIQHFSRRRPDFAIERVDGEQLVPHVFVEIKSLVNSDFNSIMDQLYDTILHTVDYEGGNFAVFVIAMKASKIAFFQFYSYAPLLGDYNIFHYKGFIPLNQLIPAFQFMDINSTNNLIDYLYYFKKYPMLTDTSSLRNLGVESTDKIPYPHIWDLLNKDHENHVHDLFTHMANNIPGLDIKE